MAAEEARARGVVKAVVVHTELAASAQKAALELGAFDAHAFAANKQLLNRSLKTDLAAALHESAKFHGHADKS